MILYNLVVGAYGCAIRAASVNNQKAAQWVKGRAGWRENLRTVLKTKHITSPVWVHCASYGEFEQGRPLMEEIRQKYPDKKILLTFFSPSGYESFKNWNGADHVCYLPIDMQKNAVDFLNITKPTVAIFIKYEFWLHHLRELRRSKIPAFLVSAVFKPHHPFFKWYGHIFRESLRSFNCLFIQDERSGRLLDEIGITNYSVCGDTRFDRVLQIKEQMEEVPEIAKFKADAFLVIAGSTWPKDDDLVIEAFRMINPSNTKLLLVPHDTDEKKTEALISKLKTAGLSCCRFSRGVEPHSRVMVLDTVGKLSKSYRYADCAYVGGGFNGGLHNILEPAVFGCPVSFHGAHHHKYNEAIELAAAGAATIVSDSADLRGFFEKFLADSQHREQVNAILTAYFQKRANSTRRVMDQIAGYLG